jgi:hypothetical protein
MLHTRVLVGLILSFVTVRMGAQAPATKPSKLVSGKIVYVAPMPTNLDQFLAEELRSWGKYRVTAYPEGVDLVMSANAPEKETQYVRKKGVPQPKKERPGPPALSIRVVDWVTNQTLWNGELVNRKPKKDEPELPPGPQTSLLVRGLTPEELAQTVARKFREYVEQLERNSRQ